MAPFFRGTIPVRIDSLCERRRSRDCPMMGDGVTRAVIVDAVRTPIGKRNGALASKHPADLLALCLNALVDRNGMDPAVVDDVIAGCVGQVGEQGANIGRIGLLAAGWPESVPGTSIDRQCGSSQQAMHFAAQGVIAGAYDVVVACGVESMSRVPMGANIGEGPGHDPFAALVERYAPVGGLQPQGIGAEILADRWGVSREELDGFSVRSHTLAFEATSDGRFAEEIIGVPTTVDGENSMVTVDQGIRPGSTVDTLAALKPAFKADGKITAGNSSQISDGASAVLIMSEARAAALGLRPRAYFHSFAVVGDDPVVMLAAPAPATRRVLERTGLSIEDIDLFEVNEAFASVVLAWQRDVKADEANVNVNGGAIALGHPLGCSGARLMTTLLNELERRDGHYGLQVMCEGGGMANATIIERA
jgi:acetyl-CoA acyltransferase